ncbi:6-phosphogluconolactonase [Candidatus Woesearchaeota archaeon]|nr:6-phosphogluconolactonase [Candidatus Woesearchaeota archaeon]
MDNGVRLTVVQNDTALSSYATQYILERLAGYRNILLPTGTTPRGLYALLRQYPDAFRHITFFNFDEYCMQTSNGMEVVSDERSFQREMKTQLFDCITCAGNYFPDLDNILQPGAYDGFIEKMGGIDLCINAMGEDGHTFGFNLPSTPFTSKTRLVTLDSAVQRINQGLTGRETPAYAITTGIATGMAARDVLFLVSGKRKAKILRDVLYGPITEMVPASVLRLHKRCTWVADEDACSLL